MGGTLKTLPIDILVTTGIVENIHMQAYCSPKEIASSTFLYEEFHDEFVWSHEEMLDFNLSFVTHEIQLCDKEKKMGGQSLP